MSNKVSVLRKFLIATFLFSSFLATGQVTRFMGRFDINQVETVDDSTWQLIGIFTDLTYSYTALDADTNCKIVQRGYDTLGRTVFDRYTVVGIITQTVTDLTVNVRSDFPTGIQNNSKMPYTGMFPISVSVTDTSKLSYRASFSQNMIDPDYDAALDNLNLREIKSSIITGGSATPNDSLRRVYDSLTNIYTEAQVDYLLSLKANISDSLHRVFDSLTNIYTEAQVNALLSGKANISDSLHRVFDSLTNIYTEAQVNGLLDAKQNVADIKIIFQPQFVDTSALITTGKVLLGYSDGYVIDTLIFILNRRAGTPSITPTIHYGLDWSAAGTSVVTAPAAVTSYSTATKVSGATLNNPTISESNMVWLTWVLTVAPKELYVVIKGHNL